MFLRLTFDCLNIFVALFTTVILFLIVFRTKKGLDKVYKFYLASSITILACSMVLLNQYLGLIPTGFQDVLYTVSRFLSQTFLLLGNVIMLYIITKESRE